MNIELLSGGTIKLMPEIDLSQLKISDVALGLSREGRFFNQTRGGTYVVAQHSCLAYILFVFDCVKQQNFDRIQEYGKEVLMHDGPEFVFKDIPTQVKQFLGDAFYAKEDEFTGHFNKHFDLKSDENTMRVIKEYDRKALILEKHFFTYIKLPKEDQGTVMEYAKAIPPEFLKVMSSEEAMDKFLSYYRDVTIE